MEGRRRRSGRGRQARGSEGSPGFAAIVVRKDTGFPGGGFFCWDGVPPALRRAKREGSNPRLSDAEKRYVRKLQEGIWSHTARTPRPAGVASWSLIVSHVVLNAFQCRSSDNFLPVSGLLSQKKRILPNRQVCPLSDRSILQSWSESWPIVLANASRLYRLERLCSSPTC